MARLDGTGAAESMVTPGGELVQVMYDTRDSLDAVLPALDTLSAELTVLKQSVADLHGVISGNPGLHRTLLENNRLVGEGIVESRLLREAIDRALAALGRLVAAIDRGTP